jgi:peptidylprolyl isomerase
MGVTRNIIKAGTSGITPRAGQTVTVHCTGYLEGRKMFWSTKSPGQKVFSFKIGMGQVIRGWDEGVMQMQVGETSELVCTGDYAYGPRGFPAWGIGPNATLTFEIELLSVS